MFYFTDSFREKASKYNNASQFSKFHLNARSLSSKFLEIKDYLYTLQHEFSIYAFTETWFKDKPSQFFNLPNYTLIQKHRVGRVGGGVCMYVKNDVIFKARPDLDFCTQSIDSLFIEVEQEGKNVIVGTVYKSPDTCGKVFLDCLVKIGQENRLSYTACDFNKDARFQAIA